MLETTITADLLSAALKSRIMMHVCIFKPLGIRGLQIISNWLMQQVVAESKACTFQIGLKHKLLRALSKAEGFEVCGNIRSCIPGKPHAQFPRTMHGFPINALGWRIKSNWDNFCFSRQSFLNLTTELASCSCKAANAHVQNFPENTKLGTNPKGLRHLCHHPLKE